MKKIFTKVFIILVLFVSFIYFFCSCQLVRPENRTKEQIKYHIKQIKNEMKSLDLSDNPNLTPSAIIFFQFYGIHFPDILHFFGSFRSGNYIIAAHIFLPDNPRGTVFLLHGYFGHTGILKNLINHCINLHYGVAVFDLPGHGLSTGERSSIHDFSEYVFALEDFIKLYSSQLPGPFYLIGHSIGGAIAFEYMYKAKSQIFSKIIFLAPLVHNRYWKLSKVGYFFFNPFADDLPRGFSLNPFNDSFDKLMERDPLQSETLPLQFLKSFYDWNRQIKNYERVITPVLIIQGTDDKVVDWRYNISFLQKKFRDVNVYWIKDAEHNLLNERLYIQSAVLQCLMDYLEQGLFNGGNRPPKNTFSIITRSFCP